MFKYFSSKVSNCKHRIMTTFLSIKVTDILFCCCIFSKIKSIFITLSIFLANIYEMWFSIIFHICRYSPYKYYDEFYINDLSRSCFLVKNSQKESFNKLSMQILSSTQVNRFLRKTISESLILFDQEFYMGSPLGPTLTNNFHEKLPWKYLAVKIVLLNLSLPFIDDTVFWWYRQ